MDFCSGNSDLLKEIICTALSLIFIMIIIDNITNIGLVTFLIWVLTHQLSGFPVPHDLYGAHWRGQGSSLLHLLLPICLELLNTAGTQAHTKWGTSVWGCLYSSKQALLQGALELNVRGVWSTAMKALVGSRPAEDLLLPSSSSTTAVSESVLSSSQIGFLKMCGL